LVCIFFRIIVIQSETFSNSEESEKSDTIKMSPSLSQIVSSDGTSQSEFHDKEVNLYTLAGHENMQL